MSASAEAYRQRLAADVAAALGGPAAGVTPAGPDRAALFAALPGYWPPDVVVALDQAAAASGPDALGAAALASALRAAPGDDPDLGDPVRLLLPVPHPLDADWRFASSAREELLERAAEAATGDCVLLGTPTLFAHACGQLDLREVVLVDRSAPTVHAARTLAGTHKLLRVVRADLNDPDEHDLAAGTAGVVVADPPWYRPEQAGFLRAAARALRPGGTLLLAASPAGSRPAGLADRDELLADAAVCGFRLDETRPGALPYSSPPFERAALAAAGVPGTPALWRSADLLVLVRSAGGAPSPSPATRPQAPWPEAAMGRTRVRAAGRLGDDGPASVAPAVPGAVSADVSRRSADREAANVWTTGNGAWTATGAGAAGLVLAAVRGERDRRLAGADLLLDSVAREQADLRAWGWA